MSLPHEIEGRWTNGVVLKRDLFSTVERGRFGTRAGEVEAVLRRIDEVPWWSFGLARHLFGRERRAPAVPRGPRLCPPPPFPRPQTTIPPRVPCPAPPHRQAPARPPLFPP